MVLRGFATIIKPVKSLCPIPTPPALRQSPHHHHTPYIYQTLPHGYKVTLQSVEPQRNHFSVITSWLHFHRFFLVLPPRNLLLCWCKIMKIHRRNFSDPRKWIFNNPSGALLNLPEGFAPRPHVSMRSLELLLSNGGLLICYEITDTGFSAMYDTRKPRTLGLLFTVCEQI